MGKRAAAAVIVGILAVAGCSNDDTAGAPQEPAAEAAVDQTSGGVAASDELKSCDEVYGTGEVVTVEVLDTPCVDPVTGKAQVLGWGDTECVDGRRMWWHDWAWGYLDEPAQWTFQPGEERVPPQDAREACNPSTVPG